MAFSEIQSTLNLSHPIFASLRNLWTFNEGSGSTVADAQGVNNGTLGTGVSWSSGNLSFAGTGQVNLATKQDLVASANWSIAFRCRPSVITSLRMVLGDNSITTEWVWFQANNNLRVSFTNQANFPLALSRDQDRSYVLTAQNIGGGFVRLTLYEDGIQAAVRDVAHSTHNLSYNVLGNGYTATTFAWQGTINWLAIWDRTLTAAEAALLVPNGLNAPPNSPPVASGVSISGSPTQGNVLTGSYTYSDADSDPQGASTFRWLRSGVAISGATSTTYTLQAADVGTTIQFEVTPVASSGSSPGATVTSSAVGPIAALPTGTITLVNPRPYQTKQRNASNQGTFLVSGTYTGTPTTIEYRFNGGSWATLIASPSGGTFSASVTLTGPAQGTFEVRFGNANSITASVGFVTVCDVFACLVDSICEGRATNLQSYSGTAFRATAYDTIGGWKEGTDPLPSNNTLGSYWPHFAQRYMARTGQPVCILNLGVGGTAIRTNTASRYTAIINASGVGGIAAVLSNGGANDLSFNLDQATNLANINSYANSWNAAYGARTHWAILGKVLSPGNPTTHAAFQRAQLEAIASNPNCVLSAILYDIDNDSIHYKTDAAHQEIGRRIDAALAGHNGPSMTSVVLTSPTTVTVTFNANLKTGRSHSPNCWRVFDNTTQRTISSVAYGAQPNQIVLTMSVASTGVVTVSLGEGQSAVGVAPAGEDLLLTGQPTLNLPAQPFYRVEAITTDGVPPNLNTAMVTNAGNVLRLTFDEAVTGTGAGFVLAASGGALTATLQAIVANVVTFSLSRIVQWSESVTLAYSGSGLADLSGNALETIATRLIANESVQGAGGVYAAASDVRFGVNRGDGVLGTLYVPPPSQVLLGVSVDAAIGTLVLPIASDVRSGVQYGAGGAEFTGTYSTGGTYTAASNVRFGTDRGDGVLGTLRVPSASQVLNGVLVDASTGNVVLPSVGDVEASVAFGASSALIGTFQVPAQSDVRSGVPYGADGVQFTGTLVVSGGTTGISPMVAAGEIESIVIGDDYLASSLRSFDWFVDVPVFPLLGSQAFFGASAKHKGDFLVEGTIAETTLGGVPKWRLRFELNSADTIDCKPGCYDWSVELRGPTPEQITKVVGRTELIEAYTR